MVKGNNESSILGHYDNQNDCTPSLDQFFSDEEPENFESQKEDMKLYLNRLNKRIEILVDAWKKAENMMSKMGDHKIIMEQAMKLREQMQKEQQEEKTKNGGKDNEGSKNKEEKTLYTNSQPITEFLREEIKKSTK